MALQLSSRQWIENVGKVIGTGPNFKLFREEKGLKEEDGLSLFMKTPGSLVTAGTNFISPDITEFICEVEMAVIIGKRAERVSEAEAADYIAGYALANDMTASSHWDNGRFKMFDQMTPIGPVISADKVRDHQNITLEMRVNGEPVQKDSTASMLYPVNWLISHISHITALNPYDVILTGTPSNPKVCAIGDVIELRSPELGEFRHRIALVGAGERYEG
ncbi:fumarylacetoacetate hydrolase family protein [Paenibacillus sp. NEAU-GSW1]|nr:fumarylacetoacetate hydrolase family protein [Paenibacillus sp. NEAU-GSW1]